MGIVGYFLHAQKRQFGFPCLDIVHADCAVANIFKCINADAAFLAIFFLLRFYSRHFSLKIGIAKRINRILNRRVYPRSILLRSQCSPLALNFLCRRVRHSLHQAVARALAQRIKRKGGTSAAGNFYLLQVFVIYSLPTTNPSAAELR